MDSMPDGISNELFQDFKRAKFELKLSQRRYLEAKVLREAWAEICLPDYKMEGASSEEQAEAFRREFRGLQDAVLLTECPLPGLPPLANRSSNDPNLQATIHGLLFKQLSKVSAAIMASGGNESGDQNVLGKVERVYENVAMLQDQLHDLRLQCAKRILELSRIFHEEVDAAVSTPELGESARQLFKDWHELKNLDLQLRKTVADRRRETLTADMMEILDTIGTHTRRESYTLERGVSETKRTLAEFERIWGDDVQGLVEEYRATRAEIEGYRVALARQRAGGDGTSHTSS